MRSTLCPPAAASTMARRASGWPLTSAKSGVPGVGGVKGSAADGGDGPDAPQGVHHFQRRVGRVDQHGVSAGLGCFGRVLRRDIQGLHPAGGSRQGHGQHAGHRAEAAIQRQLPQKGGFFRRGLDLPGRGEDGQQQGQVVHGAGLADIGRGQVDRDAAVRPFEPQVAGGGVDTVAAFPHGGIGQADNGEGGHPARDVGFHCDSKAVETVETKASDNGIHGAPFARRAVKRENG